MSTTLNSADIVGGSLSNGDLTFTKTSDAAGGVRAIASVSSARYFEIELDTLAATDVVGVGVAQLTHDLSTTPATGADFWAWFSDGSLLGPSTDSSSGSFADGSRIRVAINGGSIWFGDETAWLASGDPELGTGEQMSDVSGTVYPVIFANKNGTIVALITDGFYYDVPTGFDAMGDNDANPSDADPTTPNPSITYADPDVSATTISAPTQETWSHGDSATLVVILDSVDVSAKLKGAVTVKGRRGEAKTATFTLVPAAGSVDANDWIGKAVTIDANHASQKRLFTGRVQTPTVKAADKTVTFFCSDGIKDQINALSRSAIDTAVGGWWSQYTDNNEADGFDYLKARVATRNMSYDLDANNTGILASLESESTAHFSFDNSTIRAGSFSYKLADRSAIVNKAQVSFDFRYTRLRHRERQFSWSIPYSLEHFFTVASYDMPTKYMIEQSIAGLSGIQYQMLVYQTQPLSGLYWGIIYINGNPNFVRYARWLQAQRFSQDITENYLININAPQSQSAIGTVLTSSSYGLSAEFNASSWETLEEYEAAPAGYTATANGDYIQDQISRELDGRPAFENAIKAAQAKAQQSIRASHRNNQVSFTTQLQPELQRHHTVDVSYNDGNFTVTAKGRVLEYEHNIDPANASGPVYETRVTFDLSKTDPASPPSDPGITVPTAPDTDDTGPIPSEYRLDTHIYQSGDPTYDDTWEGFTGNDGSIYPYAFNAITQPVSADDRAHRQVAAVSSVDMPLTDDLLTLVVS